MSEKKSIFHLRENIQEKKIRERDRGKEREKGGIISLKMLPQLINRLECWERMSREKQKVNNTIKDRKKQAETEQFWTVY